MNPRHPISRRWLTLSSTLFIVVSVGCVATDQTRLPPRVAVETQLPETGPLPPGSELLGIRLGSNESDSLERLEVLPGARVMDVAAGSAADVAGLRPGDVVLSVVGHATDGPDAVDAVLAGVADGTAVDLHVRRGTMVFTTTPRLVRPVAGNPRVVHRVDPVKTRAGYRSTLLDQLTSGELAVEVVQLYPGSPMSAAGIQLGDRIHALDGVPVTSAEALVRELIEERSYGDEVRFTVGRGDGPREAVDVTLWAPPRALTRLYVPGLVDYSSNVSDDHSELFVFGLGSLSLWGYLRDGNEREYRILYFIRWSTGYGELEEEELAGRLP